MVQVIKLWLKEFEATNIVTQSGGPAARHSETNKEAKLLEKKFALFSVPTTWEEGRLLSKGWFPPQGKGKGLHAETALTVILKLVMWWFDQCHLDLGIISL